MNTMVDFATVGCAAFARAFAARIVSIAVLATFSIVALPAFAQQGTSDVRLGENDIGGIVTGPNGPEAGVWVIAETRDLPTKYVKIVATDDQGRYLIPDLPSANYDVWVRGYGLVDSPKVKAQPGKTVDLKSVAAPNRAAGMP